MTEEELTSSLAEERKGRELEWWNILERGILCALQTNSNLQFLSEEVANKNTTNLRDKYFITYKANQVRSD